MIKTLTKYQRPITVVLCLPLLYLAAVLGIALLHGSSAPIFQLKNQLIFAADLEAWFVLGLAVQFARAKLTLRDHFNSVQGLAFTLSNLLLLGAYHAFYMAQKGPAVALHIDVFLKLAPYLLTAAGLFSLGHIPFLWRSLQSKPPVQTSEPAHINLILLGFFAVGFILRIINLGGFPAYSDENNHTHAALQLLNGETLTYFRSLLTVTLPVLLSFKLLGVSLFAARLPIVLIHLLAIVPLYRLGRRVDPSVGLLAVFLFVTSPWMIAVSRNVREYGIMPLFVFWSANILLNLLDLNSDNWRDYLRKNALDLFLAIGLVVFTLTLDKFSFLKLVFVEYISFGGLLFLGLLRVSGKYKKWLMGIPLALFAVAVVIFTWYIRHMESYGHTFRLNAHPEFFLSLFNDPSPHWYFIPIIGAVLLGLLALQFGRAFFDLANSQNRATAFLISNFIGINLLLAFLFFGTGFPARPRYTSLMIYFFIPIVPLALTWLGALLKPLTRSQRAANLVFLLLLIGLFVNTPSFTKIYQYTGGENFFITGNNHYRGATAYEYLAGKIQPGDALLSNSFYYLDEMSGNRLNNPPRIHYNTVIKQEKQKLTSALAGYPHGWVVVFPDANPRQFGFSYRDFDAGNIHFTYDGQFEDVQMWHWQTK